MKKTTNEATRAPLTNGNGSRPRTTPAPDSTRTRRAVVDPRARRRNRYGDTQVKSRATHMPETDDTPFEETAVKDMWELAVKRRPHLANKLKHTYKQKLLGARETYQKLQEEGGQVLAAMQKEATAINTPVRRQIADLQDKCDANIRREQDAIVGLNAQLPKAHGDAAGAAAACGGTHDPETPNLEGVINVKRISEGEAAAVLQLPPPSADTGVLMHPVLRHSIEVVFGCLLGISLGLFTHMLEVETMTRTPWVLALLCVIGTGLAMAISYLVTIAGYNAAVLYYSLAPRRVWIAAFATAILVVIVYSFLQANLDTHGLLLFSTSRNLTAGLSQANGTTSSQASDSVPFAFWAVGLLVSLCFLGYSLFHGWCLGRAAAVATRITRLQEERYREQAERRMANPGVQTAMAAVSTVQALRAAIASHTTRIEQLSSECAGRVATLSGQLVPVPETLPEEWLDRLQDRYEQILRAQEKVDILLDKLGVTESSLIAALGSALGKSMRRQASGGSASGLTTETA